MSHCGDLCREHLLKDWDQTRARLCERRSKPLRCSSWRGEHRDRNFRCCPWPAWRCTAISAPCSNWHKCSARVGAQPHAEAVQGTGGDRFSVDDVFGGEVRDQRAPCVRHEGIRARRQRARGWCPGQHLDALVAAIFVRRGVCLPTDPHRLPWLGRDRFGVCVCGLAVLVFAGSFRQGSPDPDPGSAPKISLLDRQAAPVPPLPPFWASSTRFFFLILIRQTSQFF